VMGSRTKLLRQYFKFIRPGAVRFRALSNVSRLEPLGFTNKNGKVVAVVKANGPGAFALDALPDGAYGIKYTTASQYNVDLPDQSVCGGQLLTAQIPAAGVITIYGK
jgi:hypothetical protein